MPKITIDQSEVDVPEGATLLDAARAAGIDVPTLCFLEGISPSTSCQLCVVKLRDAQRVVPACATRAVDGMTVDSETDEVHDLRRTALELLLSDHVGDCLAPCFFNCPAHMDIPLMLQQIEQSNVREALETIKADIALPAVLGRVCSKPCEMGCRRGKADGPVAVCQLKRHAADLDLAADEPFRPACAEPTGKHVAIVGAGATGVSAAYYLCRAGHACTIFERQEKPGGRLRYGTDPELLPPEVLDAELAQVFALSVDLQCDTTVGRAVTLEALAERFDAVLIAAGAASIDHAEAWSLATDNRGVRIDRETFQTDRPGVFAAGNAIRKKSIPVRSVADGKEVAGVMDQFLRGRTPVGPKREFSVRIGRVQEQEMPAFLTGAGNARRVEPDETATGIEKGGRYELKQANLQAGRCLQCGCSAHGHCDLERYAIQYGADPDRFRGPRRLFQIQVQPAGVVFEPGKCIKCELCVQIAARAGEPIGLTFVGRGFDVQIGVPFDRSLDEALTKVAAECVAACPTAALAFAAKAPGATIQAWTHTK